MMDFGFGAFLEKFEQHFGMIATRILLALIGVTVCATCMTAIWNLVLKPMLGEIGPIAGFVPIIANTASAISVGAGVALGGWMVQRFRVSRAAAQINALMDRAEEAGQRGQNIIDRASDLTAAAQLILEAATAASIKNGLITQDQADEIQSLRDIGSETPQ